MSEQRLSPAVLVTMIALMVAAAGIAIQILGGVDYPVIPPGALILLGAAAVTGLVRRWWAPLAGTAVAVFVIVGGIATGAVADNLGEASEVGAFVGTLVQMGAVVVALLASIVAVAQNRRARQPVG